MAVVYRTRDTVLDREVAVKVMQPGQDSERFVVEAKVTAQLPHPGIPPVYSLGQLPDRRMCLAMKLVEGCTLAKKLESAELGDRPRLLVVFERVCETVGFAHSKGIVHRDLKPANVMVGDFGEVYVMDWGLAKEMAGAPEAAGGEKERSSVARKRPRPIVETQTGAGTPAYMAPEQARGENVDVRADVFGLGGVLAAILTGKAPFGGTSVIDTLLQASQAELGACFGRLDACGADPELVAVAKKCLAAKAGDRFADGAEVARAVGAYRAGVEERLRRAERERAATEAKAAEQRKRRKVQLALAAAVLLLVTGGGAFAWWQDKQEGNRKLTDQTAEAERLRLDGDRKAADARADAEAEFKGRQARQGIDASLKLSADLSKQYKFEPAKAALAQAAELAKGGAPERLAEVEQAQRDLAFVVKLDDIRYRKWAFTAGAGGEKGSFNTALAPSEYKAAFAAYGLDPTALAPADAAARAAAGGVKAEIVAAIDDWALYEPRELLRDRLLDVARLADPGPWTDRLRHSGAWAERAAVRQLAADADPKRLSPAALTVLATVMERNRLDPSGLLTAARASHPTDFELAFAFGQLHVQSKEGQQIGAYEAARALRPDNAIVWNNLGLAFRGRGDVDGAILAYRETLRLDPKSIRAYFNLGIALYDKGDMADAIEAYREALRLDPTYARAHNNLGSALLVSGELDNALLAYRESIRLNSKNAQPHNNVAVILTKKGDVEGAISAYQEAIRLDPENAAFHYSLGMLYLDQKKYSDVIVCAREAIRIIPKDARAHALLSVALQRTGDISGARAALTEAARLDKEFAPLLTTLPPVPVAPPPRERVSIDRTDPKALIAYGNSLRAKGWNVQAVAIFREAVALDPANARAHNYLGLALDADKNYSGAERCYREAIRIEPTLAFIHSNLAITLRMQKKYPEALAAARQAVELDGRMGHPHATIGYTLQATGDVEGARRAFAEAARLDPKNYGGLVPKESAPPPREVHRP